MFKFTQCFGEGMGPAFCSVEWCLGNPRDDSLGRGGAPGELEAEETTGWGPPTHTPLRAPAFWEDSGRHLLLLLGEGKLERGSKKAGDPKTEMQEACGRLRSLQLPPSTPPPQPELPRGFTLIPYHAPSPRSTRAEDRAAPPSVCLTRCPPGVLS